MSDTTTNIIASIFNIESGNIPFNIEYINDVVVIDSNHVRLGIGNASPQYSLDVSGNAKIYNLTLDNNNLIFGDTTVSNITSPYSLAFGHHVSNITSPYSLAFGQRTYNLSSPNSLAFGQSISNTDSSCSLAFGHHVSIFTSPNSLAFGQDVSNITSSNSLVFGQNIINNESNYSLAFGQNITNNSLSNYSLAFGQDVSNITSSYSLAFGDNVYNSGSNYSFAFGKNTNNYPPLYPIPGNYYNFAFGENVYNTADSTYNFAFGKGAYNNYSLKSFAFGDGIYNQSSTCCFAFGYDNVYNIPYSSYNNPEYSFAFGNKYVYNEGTNSSFAFGNDYVYNNNSNYSFAFGYNHVYNTNTTTDNTSSNSFAFGNDYVYNNNSGCSFAFGQNVNNSASPYSLAFGNFVSNLNSSNSLAFGIHAYNNITGRYLSTFSLAFGENVINTGSSNSLAFGQDVSNISSLYSLAFGQSIYNHASSYSLAFGDNNTANYESHYSLAFGHDALNTGANISGYCLAFGNNVQNNGIPSYCLALGFNCSNIANSISHSLAIGSNCVNNGVVDISHSYLFGSDLSNTHTSNCFIVGNNYTVQHDDVFVVNTMPSVTPHTLRFNNRGNLTVTGIMHAPGGHTSFTGCHGNNNNLDKSINYLDNGLIVSTNNNYLNIDYSLEPTISESLPVCKLTSIENDKSVFGVVNARITNDLTINSLGEGALWVCNSNGNLENGDYISSSRVAGYGQKQTLNEGILCNFTVAKITANCDFNLTKNVKKKVKTLFGASGENLLDYDENNKIQYIDDLDENGNQQLVYKYNTRFIDLQGNILKDSEGNNLELTQQELDNRISNGEQIYIACFVGCTYHCG
tara:strand:+ start:3440 stop:5998 length:2559 start_codon:yes stop_codon:yes gene_type:complete